MPGVSEPRGDLADSVLTFDELPLTVVRRAILAPKLAAVLAQFRQIEALERPDLEPAPPMPEVWDRDERR